MLTSRERMKMAVEHKEPDRIPIGYDSTPEAKESLKKYLNISTDDKLLERLGVDFRHVFPDYIGPEELQFKLGMNNPGIDIWRVERKAVKNSFGHYMEISRYPLKDMKSLKDIDEYSWPEAIWFDYGTLAGKIKELNNGSEYYIKLIGGSILENSWYMRGMEQFLMDLIDQPEMANAIMERVFNFWASVITKSMKAAGGKIDMVQLGDDIGGQEGMLISVNTWRKMVKPWLKKTIALCNELGARTFYHSCGSIGPVIEDLIEIGLDVLNPLQFNATGFPPPQKLKDKYGSRLCFEGGIDIQVVLPNYSEEAIIKEIKILIKTLGKNGGYIIEPSHAIQPDTKPENIMAVYDTALAHTY